MHHLDPTPLPAASPPVAATQHSPAADAISTAKKERKRRLSALGKTFGNIPGVPIFTHWASRKDCADAAVHRSWMAGICGNYREGVYSLTLSNHYADDEDGGGVIIYTGSGGRQQWSSDSPPKRVRLGPQTLDQRWDSPPNKALMMSLRTGNPIRVVRSSKCRSQYSPLTGYRYDGLYKVAACWSAKGRNGKNICRCRLERLPGQPPIPLQSVTTFPSKRKQREHLIPRIPPRPPAFTNFSEFRNETSLDTEDAQIDSFMNEVDPDVKVPLPLSTEHRVVDPRTLPRYGWNSREGLIKLGGGVNVTHGEDDATLVPSEGSIEGGEYAETEYFSDTGGSP